jgi:serine protease AprX
MDSPRRKITGQLLRSMSAVRGEQELPIIVQYVPHRQVLRHAEFRAGWRESYHYRLAPFGHAHATREAIITLEQDADVVRIYQDSPVHALLDAAPTQVGAPFAWAAGLTGAGVSLAILDTGIDPRHPDLAGRIVALYDVTGEGEADTNGHGTHCAGIAAGTGQASGGLYRGIAPGLSLLSARVLDAYGNGMMSDVMAGIDWAVARGVQIISLSLGGPGPAVGEDPLIEICNAAVEAGVMVCVAAGNTGPGQMTIGSPGAAERVLTVGAVDRQDAIASFSSRGPTGDGRVKPDIVLPGADIVSARATGTTLGRVVDAHYTTLSGTSMACPLAAGLCALALEAQPGLSPDELKRALMDSAIDLGQPANAQGAGRGDARNLFAALGVALPAEPAMPPLPPLAEPVTPTPTVPTPGPETPQAPGCLVGWLSSLRRTHKR